MDSLQQTPLARSWNVLSQGLSPTALTPSPPSALATTKRPGMSICVQQERRLIKI